MQFDYTRYREPKLGSLSHVRTDKELGVISTVSLYYQACELSHMKVQVFLSILSRLFKKGRSLCCLRINVCVVAGSIQDTFHGFLNRGK